MTVEPDPPPEVLPPLSLFFPEVTEEEAKTIDGETVVIMERRTRAMALYRRGRSMKTIAEDLRCSVGTVHRDIHCVLEGYKRITARSVAEHLADALQRINAREADIEAEWERSKGEQTETAARRGNKFDATSVKKRQRYGDPRLAALLLGCWDRRCKLLGLLKPDDDLGAAADRSLYLKVLDLTGGEPDAPLLMDVPADEGVPPALPPTVPPAA